MFEQQTLIESRVDYITATVLQSKVVGEVEINRSQELANELLSDQERLGNDVRRFRFHSFEGFQCGQVSAAVSGQGFLFRLSGDCAARRWEDVYDISTGVSRIDVAATIRENGAWIDRTRVHCDEAREYARKRSPHLSVTRIDGGSRGHTVNIGSRSSDAYGRIYDKGAESGLEAYRDCWRYEVEFKRSLADQCAATLAVNKDRPTIAAEISSQWFGTHGVSSGQICTVHSLPCRLQESSDDLRRVRWFASQVSGSLSKVIEGGRLNEALLALGLTSDVLSAAGYSLTSIRKEAGNE